MFSIKHLALLSLIVALWIMPFAIENPGIFWIVSNLTTLTYVLAFMPLLLGSENPHRAFYYGYGTTGIFFKFSSVDHYATADLGQKLSALWFRGGPNENLIYQYDERFESLLILLLSFLVGWLTWWYFASGMPKKTE